MSKEQVASRRYKREEQVASRRYKREESRFSIENFWYTVFITVKSKYRRIEKYCRLFKILFTLLFIIISVLSLAYLNTDPTIKLQTCLYCNNAGLTLFLVLYTLLENYK